VAAIESDPSYVYEDADGKVFDHYDFTFPRESWERIKEGRACFRCWELQPIPFLTATTEQCRRHKERHLPACELEGNGIQTRQARIIAEEFYGTKWIGPKQKLEATLAEDDERRAKYRQDTGLTAGIVVPSWVKI
jgi:hypothetical protein